ncbi:MAG: hypothetical protein M1297_01360 [Nitrospirae bacterium]|nr:hypothetical protein [Nitrospirota bacterium]
MSVFAVRAVRSFVELRESLSTHKELAQKIEEPEKSWAFTTKPSSGCAKQSKKRFHTSPPNQIHQLRSNPPETLP